MLTTREVAELRGVQPATIGRYLWISNDRLRKGLPLRAMDIPPQDATVRDRPLWDPAGRIAAWLVYGDWRNTDGRETTA